ncbi:MAG: cysteine--tRNA ligase [Acidimicrobiales bacterium]
MNELRLFDTSAGEYRTFDPGPVVRLYTCGVTPYDATHMGHAATYVTYDILHRRLIDRGHEVRLVRNITDIDDDLLARARRDGVNYLDLAFGQKRLFDRDLEDLGNLEPWSEPRATSAIPDIRGLIHRLLDSGHAYRSADSVYFDHSRSPGFGTVGGYSRVDMRTIGELRGENPHDQAKNHPLDTVLWKPSADDEPAWESPWGRGRPGWHIECTALALRDLGEIDLHGGGCDLVYPHHEFCEAQLSAITGAPVVKHWMHQACVHLNGEPMSKSTGNLVFVRDLLVDHDPMVIRLAVMSQHYRTQEWAWSDDLLLVATDRLARWRKGAAGSDGEELLVRVRGALDDDLDVPAAVAAIDDAVEAGVAVGAVAALLGVSV